VIAKVEWMNPHVVLYIDVKGEDGQVQTGAATAGLPTPSSMAG